MRARRAKDVPRERAAVGRVRVCRVFRHQTQDNECVLRGGEEFGAHALVQHGVDRSAADPAVDEFTREKAFPIGAACGTRSAVTQGDDVRRGAACIHEQGGAVRCEAAGKGGEGVPVRGRDIEMPGPCLRDRNEAAGRAPNAGRNAERFHRIEDRVHALAFRFIAVAEFARHGNREFIGFGKPRDEFRQCLGQFLPVLPQRKRYRHRPRFQSRGLQVLRRRCPSRGLPCE